MENQHRKIKGYRDLSQHEIDLMNDMKSMEVELLRKLDVIAAGGGTDRWVSIARTHIQQGFMAGIRAITKPGGEDA